jgi:hypothetical protein
LQLRPDRIGIDSNAGVDRRGHAPQIDLALLVNFGLDDGRDETGERRLDTDAATGARRQRLAPTGFLGDQIEGGFQTRILVEHAAPEIDRVLARFAGELVHEALGGKHVVVRSDAAPKAGGHGRRLGPHVLHLQVRNIVGHVDGAIDGVDIDAVLKPRRKPTRHH